MSVHINCANCGISFCLPDDMHKRRVEDHKRFYCPNGHINYYPGKNEWEKEIDSLKEQVRQKIDRIHKVRTEGNQCLWPDCHHQADTREGLRSHMRTAHGMPTVREWRAFHRSREQKALTA